MPQPDQVTLPQARQVAGLHMWFSSWWGRRGNYTPGGIRSTSRDRGRTVSSVLLRIILALLVLVPTVALAVGAVRGRVRVRACCPPPEQDLRMASALREAAPPPADPGAGEGAVLAQTRQPG